MVERDTAEVGRVEMEAEISIVESVLLFLIVSSVYVLVAMVGHRRIDRINIVCFALLIVGALLFIHFADMPTHIGVYGITSVP